MHRIREEGSVGAAIKSHAQHIPVKMMPREIGDFHRVVLTMEESVRRVVEVTYRSKAGRDEKAEALGITKSQMYRLLDVAHGYLSARLDDRPNNLSRLSHKSTAQSGI
jgi:DNA-directed RNA polymerase specialized sigma subunit